MDQIVQAMVEALERFTDKEILPEANRDSQGKNAALKLQAQLTTRFKREYSLEHTTATQYFVQALRIRRAPKG